MATEIEAGLRELMMRVTELNARVNALADAVGKLRQQQGQQTWPETPPGLLRGWLPTGIAAGTFGSPATKTDGILAIRSSTGWTISGAITGQTFFNCDTTSVASGKACWVQEREDQSYEVVIADC